MAQNQGAGPIPPTAAHGATGLHLLLNMLKSVRL
ncbi:hypothetical protein ABT030_52390 [Streptomyces mirabilis]